jgi:hypothetical protein
MEEPITLQGRMIGNQELEQIRQLMTEHPQGSRYKLSRLLAERWNWRTATGQLKDMAARTLLLKLEQRGWIQLPLRRRASPNRMRHRQVPSLETDWVPETILAPLRALLPLKIVEVSDSSQGALRRLFDALLNQHHYLSHRSPVGENMQYWVEDKLGRPLACVLMGAAAWQCRARDEWIGWDVPGRAARLHLITNNTRFLILPWVQVPHLASHVLGRIARRLSDDWQRKYAHRVHLLETFVDTSRFQGTCYRAANWIHVGQTTGRTRQNKTLIPQAAPKAVWLYPLHQDFRARLCAA